ncbi:Quinoprotein ethanol dehydrogenase precursor [Janthinobacterium lividum]|nr:Quinoprotein ethanol dehydrogenase precursor [Janthinobacterium lividum]
MGNVTNAMLDSTAKNPASVLSFGMGTQGQRYSPLTQINDKTVAKLVPAWSFSLAAKNSVARNRSR